MKTQARSALSRTYGATQQVGVELPPETLLVHKSVVDTNDGEWWTCCLHKLVGTHLVGQLTNDGVPLTSYSLQSLQCTCHCECTAFCTTKGLNPFNVSSLCTSYSDVQALKACP